MSRQHQDAGTRENECDSSHGQGWGSSTDIQAISVMLHEPGSFVRSIQTVSRDKVSIFDLCLIHKYVH